MDAGSIVAIILAAIAIIPGVLGFISRWQEGRDQKGKEKSELAKTDAEVAQVLVGISTDLAKSLNDRLQELEINEEKREKELASLKREVVAKEESRLVEITMLKAELSEFKDEIKTLQKNNYILCEGMRMLIRQVRRSGYEPVFDIDEALCESMNNVDKN